MLGGLTPYFDSIHGILPGTPGKPDPAVLLRAMKALEIPAEECVMIGDTTYDMQLAQAVGVEAIGVDWGVHSRDKLEACGVKVMGSIEEYARHLCVKPSGLVEPIRLPCSTPLCKRIPYDIQTQPKDIAITAQEFIHCLLEPNATLPCGGMDPDFDWFDEPEAHINAGHFRLEELKDLREWKEIPCSCLHSKFSLGRIWSFGLDSSSKNWSVKTVLASHMQPKERLVAHALPTKRSDLEMVNIHSRHAVAESKEMHSIVEGLASPKVIQKHIRSLLLYIRSIYPLPNDGKERDFPRRYGRESHHQTRSPTSARTHSNGTGTSH